MEHQGKGFFDRRFELADQASLDGSAGLLKLSVQLSPVPLYTVAVRELKDKLRRTPVLTEELKVRSAGRVVVLPKGTRLVQVLLEGDELSLKQLATLGKEYDGRDLQVLASDAE